MHKPIVIVGSANADMVIHAPRLPRLGETLVGGNFRVHAGGKGLNQAVAIAKLGGDATLLGAVGLDGNGRFLREMLAAHHVRFEGIQTADAATGTAVITVVDGDNCIVLDAGANGLLTPEAVTPYASLIAESAACVMQLEIPLETVERVCELASASATPVILNPAPYRDLPDTLLQKVDYLIPNEHEARDMTGVEIVDDATAGEAVRRLLARGVKQAIITLGDKGCVYNDGCEIAFCPAVPTTAVDTTSAGDSFIGALTVKLTEGRPLSDAVHFATKVAAITVSRAGAAESIPNEAEID